VHEPVTTERRVEALRWKRQRLSVALLKTPLGCKRARELDRLFGDIDSDWFGAAFQRPGGQHAGKIYELNGPEALNYNELAAKISKHAGREVKYVDIPAEAQKKAMLDQGMPEWQVTALLDLEEFYTNGRGGNVDGLLQQLLGRSPLTMDQFLAEFAGEFRAQATNA